MIKLDSEADVHRYLQLLTEKGLFMSIFFTKIADQQPEKNSTRDVWVATASTKYHSFSFLRRPHQQNVTLDLGYILIIFKYFQGKHCESLVNICFWRFQTIG